MSTEQQNINLIKDEYQAFGTGNMDVFFGNLSEQFEWHSRYPEEVPIAGVYKGKNELVELLQKIGENLTITYFAPMEFFASGNKVVVLGKEQATVQATQKNYQNEWVHVWEIRDGKVANLYTHNDTNAVQKAFVQ